jgi:hypothetical protein
LIKAQNKSLFFFFLLLISVGTLPLYGQADRRDTLKKTAPPDTIYNEGQEASDIEEKIAYTAEDSVIALPAEGRVLLYGKAKVDYGNMNIEAAVVEINYTKNIVTAYGRTDSIGRRTGTPVFRDGSETMEAEKIIYNLKTKKGKIYNALTRQGELLVIGNEIKKDSNNVIYMRDMKCIPCQEADSRTMFRATRAKIIPNDKIVTGPMYLEIGGVPTPLGLPFGYFPNTRRAHSGIILPMYGYAATKGFNLRQGGFYWGINDKTDMTIRGDIWADGSFSLKTNNNYNFIYKSNGNVNLGFTQLDEGDIEIPAEFSRNRSYEVRWLHNQDNRNNPSTRFSADVNFVSNQNVSRLTSVNTGQFLRNNFQSNISFSKTYKFGTLGVNASHDQASISNRMNIVLPQLSFNLNRFYPFKRENAVKQNFIDKIGVQYNVNAKNTLSGADSTILKGSVLDSMKYSVTHTLPISTNIDLFKYITASPALQLSAAMFPQSVEKRFDETTKKVVTSIKNGLVTAYDARFSTAFTSKVYFDYLFRKGFLKQIRHLMMPNVTYGYRPDFGEAAYGFWRSVQSDTIGNQQYYSVFERNGFYVPRGKENSVSVSLQNIIDAKSRVRTDTGITWKKTTIIQNLGISAGYNFAADSMKMSDIHVTARTVLFKYFDINTAADYKPYVYDQNQKRYRDKLSYANGPLARFVGGSASVNTSIGSNMLQALKAVRQPPDQTNAVEKGSQRKVDESAPLPWNLRAGYNLSLYNDASSTIQPNHYLDLSGELLPTKNWKIGFRTGYDFNTGKLSTTSITVYRDLKCWEASINWWPFGINKSYNIAVNLKTSMLRDIKIPKQKPPF